MFLKPGAKNTNEIRLVAPTGVEPVFGRGRVFAARFCQRIKDLRRVESTSIGRGQKSCDRCCSERTKRCEVTYSYASIGERRYDALAA